MLCRWRASRQVDALIFEVMIQGRSAMCVLNQDEWVSEIGRDELTQRAHTMSQSSSRAQQNYVQRMLRQHMNFGLKCGLRTFPHATLALNG